MKAIGIIPARYNSSRLPGKPLADIQGKPMIQWVWESARRANVLDRLLIATDDKRIEEAAIDFGAEVVMTSENCQNGTERVQEAFDSIQEDYDVIVNIQGDEPFVSSEHLNKITQLFDNEQIEIGSLYKNLNDKELFHAPSTVKVVCSENGKALYFSRSAIPHSRESEDHLFKKHIGLYAYRPSTLEALVKLAPGKLEQLEMLEQLRWLEHGFDVFLAEVFEESISVDTEIDLKRAREIAVDYL